MAVPIIVSWPSWLKSPVASSWNFTTSEGGEFDALVVAAGKGSFYVKDDNDPDGIVHERDNKQGSDSFRHRRIVFHTGHV